MTSDKENKIIYYSLAEIPDDCFPGETLDLEIQWETAPSSLAELHETSVRNSELNELLEQKVRSLLKDKNGCLIHIKKETIQHSIHYAHGSHVVRAEYNFIIYRKKS